MEEGKVVVDASVVVKWFLEEEFSDCALRLRDNYINRIVVIVAPSLLEYEVLNALRFSGVYTIDELKEIGRALNKYGFEIYDFEGDLKDLAVDIALKSNTTIYDASYIALAKKLNTVLYTADNELIQKFPEIAVHIKQYPAKHR